MYIYVMYVCMYVRTCIYICNICIIYLLSEWLNLRLFFSGSRRAGQRQKKPDFEGILARARGANPRKKGSCFWKGTH